MIRKHYWFWQPYTAHKVKDVRTLVREYLTSVGHGCTLLLNINPDTRGLVPEKDMTAYKQLGKAIKMLYSDPVMTHRRPKLYVGKCKVWKFEALRSLNGSVVLMEDIEKSGQLVMEYQLKFKTSRGWVRSSEELETTIGHKRIHPFPKTLARRKVHGISLKITKLLTKQKSVILRQVSVYDWNEAAKKLLV